MRGTLHNTLCWAGEWYVWYSQSTGVPIKPRAGLPLQSEESLQLQEYIGVFWSAYDKYIPG